MTRFVIDPVVAVRLIREERAVAAEHKLVAPSLLRSDVLSLLYRERRAGTTDAVAARAELDRLAELPIRLLGDRVSRATAWRIAEHLDWEDVRPAEYLAVAKLQADAIVTDDPLLVAGAEGTVPRADYEDLFH
jgi:predicted nucleic acid-binding protein